jgi:hypothetical protein
MSEAQPPGQQSDLVYVVIEGAMFIEATPEKAWPHVLDYKSWQTYSISEHISGEPGREGEVVRLKKDEPGASATAYYARTVRLDPGRRLIWKTFRDHTGYFGIVDFRLRPEGGGTRFTWDCIYEYAITYDDPAELETFRREQTAAFELGGSVIYPKLKALVERDG